MYFRLAKRLLLETDKRLLWKLAWNFGYKGIHAIQCHKKRLRQGRYFPAFLYVSVTNACHLRCQGCWVDVDAKPQHMDGAVLDRLIAQCREAGSSFLGILGGEPLLHPHLMEVFARHPGCYFQLFTHGQLMTDETARELRRLGNVSPLVSIEGSETVSDERRGRPGVYGRSMDGLEHCLRHRLFTGVCTSLCRTNYDDLLNEAWVDRLIEMGVMYVWYYVYRPVGARAHPELCLTPEQQRGVRRFVVEMRARKPIFFVDSYFDHDGRALCPAVSGLSHHVSPWGDIEPCPVIQFARESIHSGVPLAEIFDRSAFLKDFRETVAKATRGCVVLERPDLLREIVLRHGARDTTARQTALAELEAMVPRSSQYDPGQEVPERNWPYRLAKKWWFNDFGAYGSGPAGHGPGPGA